MNSGIYQIKNKNNGKLYVGSAKNFSNRWNRHLYSLKGGFHHSIKLQRSYDKHGEESFEFSVIEELPYKKDIILERENFWIKELNSKDNGYNIADASFGDVISNHPNKENIISKRTKSHKATMDKLGIDGRRKKYGKSGDKNGRYDENTHFYCKCGNRITKMAQTCSSCRDRNGKNNPFYGKNHSDFTKRTISENRKGCSPVNIKTTSADGNIFENATKCAKFFNISPALVTYRVKSDKWKNWFYINA